MNTIPFSLPAWSQLPLIGQSHRTTKDRAIKVEWHPTTFLVRIVTKVCQAIASRVPVGYEDETGFHYGVANTPLPGDLTRPQLTRSRSGRGLCAMGGLDRGDRVRRAKVHQAHTVLQVRLHGNLCQWSASPCCGNWASAASQLLPSSLRPD